MSVVSSRVVVRAAASVLVIAGLATGCETAREAEPTSEPATTSASASPSTSASPSASASPSTSTPTEEPSRPPTESPSGTHLTLKPTSTRSDARTDGPSSPSADASSSTPQGDAAPDEWFTSGSTFDLPPAVDPIGVESLDDGIGQLSSDTDASDYAISGTCEHGLDSSRDMLETTCQVQDLNRRDRTATWVITATPAADDEFALTGTVR